MASETYNQALATFRVAAAKFSSIQAAYRGREIGDAEFLAGRAAFDAAMTVLDAAEAAEIAREEAA